LFVYVLYYRKGDVDRVKKGIARAKEDGISPIEKWDTFELQAIAASGNLPSTLLALDNLVGSGYLSLN
jgi:hypothetical protein